jgi:hypothetical protein
VEWIDSVVGMSIHPRDRAQIGGFTDQHDHAPTSERHCSCTRSINRSIEILCKRMRYPTRLVPRPTTSYRPRSRTSLSPLRSPLYPSSLDPCSCVDLFVPTRLLVQVGMTRGMAQKARVLSELASTRADDHDDRLTPPCRIWMTAFTTCIGFLDPLIVAEQSLIPHAVRSLWMVGGTARPNPT